MTATSKCPSCGSGNAARAKFCGDCGERLAPAAAPAPATAGGAERGGILASPILRWFAAGTVVLALHAAAIILALRGGAGGSSASTISAAPLAPFASGQGSLGASGTTDISNMSPREAADRLYDRIARATEGGDTAQVAFFGPMALQAYAAVSPLDPDARLHIGLIHLALDDAAGAAAQADTIGRSAASHLFGPMLRARAAQARGDQATLRAAYRTFLQNYESERARRLDEYELHNTMLAQARDEARRAAGGSN
jgi:hypothetical protein